MNSNKNILGLTLLFVLSFNVLSAQYAEKETDSLQHYGFDKHKLFAGGSVNLGYGAGQVSSFAVGVLPEIGYSFKEWLDVGLAFNINYYSESDDNYNHIAGFKATSYGAGVFIRVHPLEGYFIQAQPEVNNFNVKFSDNYGNYFRTSTSYLVGIGWGKRIIGESSFFTTIMVDLGNEPNTPYKVNGYIVPVIRTGLNFYF